MENKPTRLTVKEINDMSENTFNNIINHIKRDYDNSMMKLIADDKKITEETCKLIMCKTLVKFTGGNLDCSMENAGKVLDNK